MDFYVIFCLQKLGCVSDLLATMKLMCLHMWPNEVRNVDDLRLEIALRMLKSPHFNARMNSLKEVSQVCLQMTERSQLFNSPENEIMSNGGWLLCTGDEADRGQLQHQDQQDGHSARQDPRLARQ